MARGGGSDALATAHSSAGGGGQHESAYSCRRRPTESKPSARSGLKSISLPRHADRSTAALRAGLGGLVMAMVAARRQAGTHTHSTDRTAPEAASKGQRQQGHGGGRGGQAPVGQEQLGQRPDQGLQGVHCDLGSLQAEGWVLRPGLPPAATWPGLH